MSSLLNPNRSHLWSSLSSDEEKFHDDEEKFHDDEEKFHVEQKSGLGILLVGQTGTGKSSIIKLMTNNGNVKVSSATTSCTTDLSVIEFSHSNIYYIDTQGTSDSKCEESTSTILKKTMLALYKNGIKKIKIIWTVCNEITRTTEEYNRQAHFISTLGKKSINGNVWNSCIIIRKNAVYNCDCQGPLDAAYKYSGNKNNNISKNIMGIKCIDWIINDNKNGNNKDYKADIETYNALKSTWTQEKLKLNLGFITEKCLKDEITKKLNGISSIEINFNIMKCKHCNIIGDKDYVIEQCHLKEFRYHQGIEPYHSGSSCWGHDGVDCDKVVPKDTVYDAVAEMGKNSLGLGWAFYLHPGTHIARLFDSNEQTVTVKSCCQQYPVPSGCKYLCSECIRPTNSSGCQRRCIKCGIDFRQHNAQNGCKSKCADCHKPWGKGPCNQTEYQ